MSVAPTPAERSAVLPGTTSSPSPRSRWTPRSRCPPQISPPHTLAHTATRGHVRLSWAIVLRPEGTGTRVQQLRLRLATVLGGATDRWTVEGPAVGLRERVTAPPA